MSFQAWKMVFLNSMTFHDQGSPWCFLPASIRGKAPVSQTHSKSTLWNKLNTRRCQLDQLLLLITKTIRQ